MQHALTTNRLNKVIILEALDLAKSTNRSVSRARAFFAAVGSVCKSVTIHQLSITVAGAAALVAYGAALVEANVVLAIASAVGIASGFVAYKHAPNYSRKSNS